ncbi:zinc-binding dehydrogenase [Amycolatopsis sp. 195334CR]|uniref:zinc-binding dehydrogenase n=1 Tax=Amycolatopsis sp. 195334CR TaxID=2814588 RepID=UPI001F5D5C3E|nr:zinc-binding dehydrogenase [Amycolatopsis sp. 195334CR]
MLRVEEVPAPVAGPGQVVVGVAVADVLFLEAQLRGGWGAEYFGLAPPYTPGTGVAGRVLSTGEGVDPAWVGKDVVAGIDGGGYAEQALVPAANLVEIPGGLDTRTAAALLQTGPAALSLIDAAKLQPGTRVLVTAAAGGLGTLLVQLAKAAGAHVTAAARGTEKLELARELGAAEAIDYTTENWTDGLEVDVVFDGVGGEIGRAAFHTATRHFFAYGVPSGAFTEIDEADRRRIEVTGIEQVQFGPAELRDLVARVLDEAAADRVKPVIGRTFPLARAADAHATMESRAVLGKTLLLA